MAEGERLPLDARPRQLQQPSAASYRVRFIKAGMRVQLQFHMQAEFLLQDAVLTAQAMEKMAQQAEGLEWSLLDVTGKRIFLPKTMLFLGREDCDVNIQSRSVDKRHAVLNYDTNIRKFQIKDLSSINGTFVNDVRISEDEYVTLDNMDSLRFGYDPMFYRMEKIEESPNLESLESLELLSPTKDIPSWALRDTQPQPQGQTLQGDSATSTLAECPGCIAEQGIRHTCGHQEDSDYGSQCSLSGAQQNGHATVTTTPAKWQQITSPDFGEYTLTLATLGREVHTTEDLSGTVCSYPHQGSSDRDQPGLSYQVVQQAVQPSSVPHSYPQSHIISPRPADSHIELTKTVVTAAPVVPTRTALRSPEDGTVSYQVISTSGAAVTRRQRPVTLSQSFIPPTVLSTIPPQSPVSGNSGVRSYVYSEPPHAHSITQAKSGPDSLSSHVLQGIHPTLAHSVTVSEGYSQIVSPRLSPDSAPLDLSLSSRKSDSIKDSPNTSQTSLQGSVGSTHNIGQHHSSSNVTVQPQSQTGRLQHVVKSHGLIQSQGSLLTSQPVPCDRLTDKPTVVVYANLPHVGSSAVPGHEVRPPDSHVHLEKDFFPNNSTVPASTQMQDGVYVVQVQLQGSTPSAATAPVTSSQHSLPSLNLQQLQQLQQQQLQQQQQTQQASSQFTSKHQMLLSSLNDTIHPSYPSQQHAQLLQQHAYVSQTQPQISQQHPLAQQHPIVQQHTQQLKHVYINQQHQEHSHITEHSHLTQQHPTITQHQQLHLSQPQVLQVKPTQQLQLQLQQQQQQIPPTSQQLSQQQQLLQQQPQQLQQEQSKTQPELQHTQPVSQETQNQQLMNLQLQSQQPATQLPTTQYLTTQPTTQQPTAEPTQQHSENLQQDLADIVNGKMTSPSSSQGSSPQHKVGSNMSSPTKSQNRKDQRRSLTGQEKELGLGTVYGATPLYGQPAWWGDDDREDKKGDKNGAERPDSLSLEQPLSPDMNKYKTDPRYAVTYMEIPGDSRPSPDKKGPQKSPQDKASPEAPPQPSMAFTIDMGETTNKGPRLSMGEGLSKFLPQKVRKSFKARSTKKDDEKSDENSSTTGSTGRGPPHKSPGPRRKSGYHSDGHQSNVSSDNEDLSIRSDTITTKTTAGKKPVQSAGQTSGSKSTSGINRERTYTVMKHNKAPRDPARLSKSKTPTPGKTEKPPRDSRQRSHTAVPMTSEVMSNSKNYLIEKMFSTQAGRGHVTSSNRAPMPDSSEYQLYREAKAYDAKIAALSEPLTPPPIIEHSVPKAKKSAKEPVKAKNLAVKKSKERDGDNVSEAGTYTIEADTHSKEEDTARRSIDQVFGLQQGDKENEALTEDEEEEIKDEVADDGLMEGKLRRLAEEKQRTHPALMTDSLEVEVDKTGYQEEPEDDSGFHPPDLTEMTGDTPKWMRHWTTSPSGAKVKTRPAPPKFTPAAPSNSAKDSLTSEHSRRRRKLPTPPNKTGGSEPSTPRSAADPTSPRLVPDLSFKPVSFDGLLDDALADQLPRGSRHADLSHKNSELFIPISHDSDSDDSAAQLNGYQPAVSKTLTKTPNLDSRRPPKAVSKRETTPREKAVTPRDKVVKNLSSRTVRGRSLPHDLDDTVELRSESEASIVSTSTDYSECHGSPRSKRKTAKSPISNLAKTNRAFALRRARLENSESEPTQRSARGSDSNLSRTRPGSGGKGDVKSKSGSQRFDNNMRPSSANSHRSDYKSPLVAKHAKDNQVRAKSAGPGLMTHSDGRLSLRTGKASPTTVVKKSEVKSKSPGVGGARSSPSAGLGRGKLDSRSHSPRTEEHNAWQRRKGYDPRKAVADAKAKVKDGRVKTERSISVDSSEADLRSRSHPLLSSTISSVSSEGEESLLSEDRRAYDRSSLGRHNGQAEVEISQLSSELTRDLHLMSRDLETASAGASLPGSVSAMAHGGTVPKPPSPHRPVSPPLRRYSNSLRSLGVEDLGPLASISHPSNRELNTEGYDNVMISSIYQLSLKVKTQTERLMERMQDEYRLSNSPSPTDDPSTKAVDSMTNQELAGILRNLRHTEQKLQRIDRGIFPQNSTCAATNGSPQNHQQYLRELERIRTEIAGFKPIDTPTSTATPSGGKSRSRQWKSTKQDVFPGDDFY